MDKLLTQRDVEELLGVKKTKLYTMLAAGEFPQPIVISSCLRRWPSSHVQAWINNQIDKQQARI